MSKGVPRQLLAMEILEATLGDGSDPFGADGPKREVPDYLHTLELIEKREALVQAQEEAILEREEIALGKRSAIETHAREMHECLLELRNAGLDVVPMMASLPRLAPPPGERPRRQALNARQSALAQRQSCVRTRENAVLFLEAALAEGARLLKSLEEQVAALTDGVSVGGLPEPSDSGAPEIPSQVGSPPAMTSPPPIPDESERRIRPRVRIDTEIDMTSQSNFFSGFTRDISTGGLFIATFDLQPLGTELDLRFTLPNSGEVRARAVVRWLRGVARTNDEMKSADDWPGIGVEFVEINEAGMKAIEDFMRHRDPIFYVD